VARIGDFEHEAVSGVRLEAANDYAFGGAGRVWCAERHGRGVRETGRVEGAGFRVAELVRGNGPGVAAVAHRDPSHLDRAVGGRPALEQRTGRWDGGVHRSLASRTAQTH